MSEVADPAKQPPGDSRSAARAPGNFVAAIGGDIHAEEPRGASDDLLKLLDGVEIEPDRDAEAVAERRRQQALAGGGADQSDEGRGVRRELEMRAATAVGTCSGNVVLTAKVKVRGSKKPKVKKLARGQAKR